jgi:tetratricopeptide (TPR) repeat protein
MRRLRRPLAAVAAGLALFASTPSYGADPPSDAQGHTAATHFDRGVKLYEERDFRTALVEFERAYALSPQYRVLYNIGQCRYQLEDYVGSLQAFDKYLSGGSEQIPQDRREQVQASINELRGRVAHVRVVANVDGAEVTVDDAIVGTTPLPAPLLVSAGRRKIATRKAGRSVVHLVDLAGEDAVDVAFELDSAPLADEANPAAKSRGDRSIVPAIAAFGVAAAGAAVGTMFGIEAIENKSALNRTCTRAGVCAASSQSLIDEARRNAAISSIGFAVGVAGLGTGILIVLWPMSRADQAATGFGSVRPFVGLGAAGAIGRFQ